MALHLNVNRTATGTRSSTPKNVGEGSAFSDVAMKGMGMVSKMKTR